MKTFKETKSMIGFYQDDDFFLEYIQRLVEAGVMIVNKDDVIEDVKVVSDEFYQRIAAVFGVTVEDEQTL